MSVLNSDLKNLAPSQVLPSASESANGTQNTTITPTFFRVRQLTSSVSRRESKGILVNEAAGRAENGSFDLFKRFDNGWRSGHAQLGGRISRDQLRSQEETGTGRRMRPEPPDKVNPLQQNI
jgi:hypothetical protein